MNKKDVIITNKVTTKEGHRPSSSELRFGEIGINIADGVIFFKKDTEEVISIGEKIDTSGFATTYELQNYVLLENMNARNFASETYVNNVVDAAIALLDIPDIEEILDLLPPPVDLTEYTTFHDVHILIDAIDIQGAIDLTPYATLTYVDNLVANGIDGLTVSLSGYALESHTHNVQNIDGLDVNTFATSTHTHDIGDVTNLQSTLDGKSDSNHTHTNDDITDFDLSTFVTEADVDVVVGRIATKAKELLSTMTSNLTKDYNGDSWGYNYATTKTDEKPSAISVKSKRSGSACTEGHSFGILADKSGIWVNHGCRATFTISYGGLDPEIVNIVERILTEY